MSESVRILSVDDDADFAATAAAFLERESDRFEVTTAPGAEDAMDRLADESVDCIVSDYEMPATDGIEFLEAVREEYPDLPFILFTGKGSEAVAGDAISAGVTDYLQKETGTDQFTVLANRIANAVDHSRTRREAERSRRRLRRIIDAVPHLIYVVDREGQYLLANEALAAFHGTTVDALEGSSVEAVLDEEASQRFLENVAHVVETGGQKPVPPAEVEDADGNRHVLEPRLLPYDLASTDGRAALGVATDVTDRVDRERRLDTIVDRLEALHEATRDLIHAGDRETVSGTLTDAVRDIFAYGRTVVRYRDGDQLSPVAVSESARADLGERPTYALDEGLPGRSFQSGEPIVIEDFEDRDDVAGPAGHRSALYLPIGDHGTLTIGHPEPAAFDESERWLAELLVNNAAAVLDRLGDEPN